MKEIIVLASKLGSQVELIDQNKGVQKSWLLTLLSDFLRRFFGVFFGFKNYLSTFCMGADGNISYWLSLFLI